MTRRDILLFAAGLAATATGIMAGPGGSLLDRFHATYGSLRTVRCSFRSAQGINGTITARRGGSYRITVPDRTIVSDATSVWSATTSARTVIINRYRATSGDLSLEKIFFEIMTIYRGSVLTQSKRGGGTVRLEPPASNAVIAGVSRADVDLDPSLKVTAVTVTVNGSTQTFRISGLALNPKVSDAEFTYRPPKGWETIDLR